MLKDKNSASSSGEAKLKSEKPAKEKEQLPGVQDEGKPAFPPRQGCTAQKQYIIFFNFHDFPNKFGEANHVRPISLGSTRPTTQVVEIKSLSAVSSRRVPKLVS